MNASDIFQNTVGPFGATFLLLVGFIIVSRYLLGQVEMWRERYDEALKALEEERDQHLKAVQDTQMIAAALLKVRDQDRLK